LPSGNARVVSEQYITQSR